MPTFQSIGLHPELCSRLLTQSAYHVNDTAPHQHQLIETPQALLSRNPHALRLLEPDGQQSRPIAPGQARKLREEVAEALIFSCRSGKRQKMVTAVADDVSPVRAHALEQRLSIPGTLSALSLLQYQMTQRQRAGFPFLSTGCLALDALMAEPPEYTSITTRMDIQRSNTTSIPFGQVIQLSGHPASGKTQLSLCVAVTPGLLRTWYLGSNAPLRSYASRLRQLASTDMSVSERTTFVAIQNDYSLLRALADLESSLDDFLENNQGSPHPCLVIVDSVSGCLTTESESMLRRVSCALRRLARQYSAAVIVTNGVVAASSYLSQSPIDPPPTRSSMPALGRLWKKATDVEVWLERLPNGVHQATLDRHASKASHSTERVQFRITETGIEQVGTA